MADEITLTNRSCEACTKQTPPLEGEKLKHFFDTLNAEWELIDNHHLTKTYKFKNFRQALDFTNKIGEMSEEEGHHPEILLEWGRVKLTVYTHVIDVLSENDFIWAAKAEKIYQEKFEEK